MLSLGKENHLLVLQRVVVPSSDDYRPFITTATHSRNIQTWRVLRGGGLGHESSSDSGLLNSSIPHHQQHKCYNVSSYSMQNKRAYMQDEYFQNSQGTFVSIMDGHGGGAVSKYVRQNLYARFLQASANILCDEPMNSEQSRHELVQGDGDNLTYILLPHEWLAHAHDTSWRTMTHRISADAHVQLDNNLVQLPSSAHPWMIPQPIQSSIKALRHAFETIDTEILRVSHWSFQGSTAVTVLLQSLDDTTTLPSGNSMASNAHGPPYPLTALIAANVGDSRAVLCRAGMAINLTNDHKPNHPLERIRIEKFGGKVQYCKAHGSREVIDHHNTYILGSGQAMSRGVYRINGNLALSRALGDRSERPLISSEVDISYTVLNPATDEFIILASDGLWDVFDTSQDVVNLVHWLLNKERTKIHDGPSDQSLRQDLARLLVQEAVRRGSTDNISVAIIYLV